MAQAAGDIKAIPAAAQACVVFALCGVAEGQTPVNMSVNMPRQMCRGHSVVAAVAVAAVRGAGIAARGIGWWWVLLRTHSDCVFVRLTVAVAVSSSGLMNRRECAAGRGAPPSKF